MEKVAAAPNSCTINRYMLFDLIADRSIAAVGFLLQLRSMTVLSLDSSQRIALRNETVPLLNTTTSCTCYVKFVYLSLDVNC